MRAAFPPAPVNSFSTRCTGLEFRLDGKLHSIGASREVILCAGAIHTPCLLLLSGIGPHDELERLGIDTLVDLQRVGTSLQDHPLAAGLCFEAKRPLPPPNNNLAGSTFFWKSRSALGRPDLMLLPVQFPFVSHEIGAQYPMPPNAFVIVPALVRVQSRGYLRMMTAEPNGPLEIQPNLLAEQADVDALVAGIGLGLDIASQPAFRALIKRRVAPPKRLSREDTVAFIRRSCLSYHHPVGTCAMGSGQEAVVDAELRVRGVEGLRIADASVMPTIPSANTHAPAVMIGGSRRGCWWPAERGSQRAPCVRGGPCGNNFVQARVSAALESPGDEGSLREESTRSKPKEHCRAPGRYVGDESRRPVHSSYRVGGSYMDPWFVALASSIPVAAALFVWTHRWRERVRARRRSGPILAEKCAVAGRALTVARRIDMERVIAQGPPPFTDPKHGD